ncbi:MAG TPA: ABC transporter permease [Dehalococcoidales bacterium]|nr:ABC transporter permease [Dehalococcoidales bacterium]
MGTYLVRRLILMVVVILIVTLIVFFMVRLLPGDPILMYLTRQDVEQFTIEQVDLMRKELGMDRPLVVQYFEWLGNIVQGDLGMSLVLRRPVIDDIVRRLPVTLHLGMLAFIVGIVVGIPMGIVAAIRRGGWLDQIFTTLGNLGITIPIFWLGILLIYFFGLRLDWLPMYGYTSPFSDPLLNLRQIILPVFCLSVPAIASSVRLTRSSMLEVMRQDYIRTAWSKGLNERTVIAMHALKNGLIPVITLKGITIVTILGGSVFVETVFNIPGMGRLAVEALRSQDYPVIQGIILMIAIVVSLSNLLVDLSWGWLDPRVRFN